MIDAGRHNVLGIRIDAVDYEAAVDRIITAAQGRRPLAVSALAVHGVMTGVLDIEHRYRLNAFDLIVPDGQPVRWALEWLHRVRLADRVYGPTLMLRVCERAAHARLPIFLYGGTADLLAALRANLHRRFPQLVIGGALPSHFRRVSAEEQARTVRAIRNSQAAITFVGLGCPRQEIWTFEMRQALSMPVLAVGAAFSFHAGASPQAPRILQDAGLEWCYRLLHEPARLWRRYLLLNPLFLTLLALQMTSLVRIDPDTARPPRDEVRYG